MGVDLGAAMLVGFTGRGARLPVGVRAKRIAMRQEVLVDEEGVDGEAQPHNEGAAIPKIERELLQGRGGVGAGVP